MKRSMQNNNVGLKAVILDMDGVITQTAKVHKKAWKKMFDAFLEVESKDFEPFTDADYLKYVDGKPRYKGVQSFLQSRNMDVPYGSQDDSEQEKTVCGLGNRKNKIFLQLIETNGVDVYEDTVKMIKQWIEAGLKIAVISSSKNCKQILQTANILDLFDVRIDGVVSSERNLEGKPEPDIFLEAAQYLGVSPDACVVFEDAISGVQAGTKGNFTYVVGVNRGNNRNALLNNGADKVIDSLNEIKLSDNKEIKYNFKRPLNIFLLQDVFEKLLKNKKPVFFLDYDGTLTPIVKHPEDAVLSDDMKNEIRNCASKYFVAVVSGRDMDDVKDLVGLEELYYAGSHGFRISGPDGLYHEHKLTNEILPKLNQIEKKLNKNLSDIEGVKIERKRYAIAVHYRNVAEKDVATLKDKVENLVNKSDGLRIGGGKKIFEIKPDIDWHKGKAISWILNTLELKEKKEIIPIYIGDDITDEDAFKEIENSGVGILVGFHDDAENTRAKYSLKNVYQVQLFLQMLAQR